MRWGVIWVFEGGCEQGGRGAGRGECAGGVVSERIARGNGVFIFSPPLMRNPTLQ